MIINRLSLLNFKNISQAELELIPSFNCLVGLNGAGKTNVIDALYFLSMSKSAFGMTDGQCIGQGEDFFMISGDYTSDSLRHESVVCSFKRGGGKSIKRSGKEYERLADHIGVVPVVIVSPNDVFLVNDAADERRRWLNSFISQSDAAYLDAVMRYNKLLAQRNRLLKQMTRSSVDILEVIDSQMVDHATLIHSRRSEAIEQLHPIVADYYERLCDRREQVSLTYRSELNDKTFDQVLADSREKDLISQFTTSGIHRDDMVMRIGGNPLRRYGSQGQQKSFLIALKLAQRNILATHKDEKPILLLDDLFDKLDADRLTRLIDLIGGEEFGQTLITDCNGERLMGVMNRCGVRHRVFEVVNGDINQLNNN